MTHGDRVNPETLAVGQLRGAAFANIDPGGMVQRLWKDYDPSPVSRQPQYQPDALVRRNQCRGIRNCRAILVLPQLRTRLYAVGLPFDVVSSAFPGFAICVYLASYDWEYRKASHVLVMVILGALFLLYWVYLVRRGPTFTFLIIVVYSFYLARPRKSIAPSYSEDWVSPAWRCSFWC